MSTSNILGRLNSTIGGGGLAANRLRIPPKLGTFGVTSSLTDQSFRASSTAPFVPGSFYAKKKAAKRRRYELNKQRKERLERLPNRRDHLVRGEKREAFRSFFLEKRQHEQWMERKARQAGMGWKIEVAVALQKYHMMHPEKPKWMTDFEELQEYIGEVTRPKYPKELFDESNLEDQTEEEALKNIRALFPPGYEHPPRITEADKTGNIRTNMRQLEKDIFFFVKEGGNPEWHLPTVPVGDDDTLLSAGRKAITERVGKDLVYWCPSHAPLAVDMRMLPKEEREATNIFGVKQFLMKFVQYQGDISQPDVPLDDVAWFTKDEAVDNFKLAQKDGELKSKFYFYFL